MSDKNNLYLRILSILNENDIVLDIGCGDKSYTLEAKCNLITIDAWEKAEPDILLDVSKHPLPFEDDSIDIILMLDLIEHLEKDEGEALLKEAERVGKKCLFLLTPLIWDDNKQHVDDPDSWYFNNQFNLHKSLWTETDFFDWERWPMENRLKNYFVGIKFLDGTSFVEQLLKKLNQ